MFNQKDYLKKLKRKGTKMKLIIFYEMAELKYASMQTFSEFSMLH